MIVLLRTYRPSVFVMALPIYKRNVIYLIKNRNHLKFYRTQ